MNRTEFYETLQDIYGDLAAENGNFRDAYGNSPERMEEAKFIATVALMAVDRYYSNLTKLQYEHKAIEEAVK